MSFSNTNAALNFHNFIFVDSVGVLYEAFESTVSFRPPFDLLKSNDELDVS